MGSSTRSRPAGAVRRAGRGAIGAAGGERRAGAAEDAAGAAAGGAHRGHDRRLGAVVRRRREDRRVVAIAARAQEARSPRRRSRSRGRGSRRGACRRRRRWRRGRDRSRRRCGRRPGGRSRRDGCGCGWPARARRAPARPARARPLGVLLEVGAHDEEGGPHAVAREQVGEAGQAAPQDREARRLGRRVRQGVDAVVAGDRVEIDGHATEAICTILPGHARGAYHARAPIDYRVAMPEPASHEFEVEMRVPALPERDSRRDLSSRPGRRAATWCATSSATSTAWPSPTRRGRPLPRRGRLDKQRWRIATGGRPFGSAIGCSRSRPACARRSSTPATATGTAPACSSSSTGELGARAGSVVAPRRGLAGGDGSAARRAGQGGARPAARGRAPATPRPTSTSSVDAPFEVGTHATARVFGRADAFELALYGRTNAEPARLVDILRRVVAGDGADVRAAASLSTATSSSCTRCRSGRAASSTGRR